MESLDSEDALHERVQSIIYSSHQGFQQQRFFSSFVMLLRRRNYVVSWWPTIQSLCKKLSYR